MHSKTKTEAVSGHRSRKNRDLTIIGQSRLIGLNTAEIKMYHIKELLFHRKEEMTITATRNMMATAPTEIVIEERASTTSTTKKMLEPRRERVWLITICSTQVQHHGVSKEEMDRCHRFKDGVSLTEFLQLAWKQLLSTIMILTTTSLPSEAPNGIPKEQLTIYKKGFPTKWSKGKRSSSNSGKWATSPNQGNKSKRRRKSNRTCPKRTQTFIR